MKAKLFCKTGQLAGASFEIANEATIGKNPDNTIVLYPQIISGRHARIFYDANARSYFLEDLGSRNSTKLDGIKVKQKERLGHLHVITFADHFDFIFQTIQDAEQAAQPKTAAQQQEPRRDDKKRLADTGLAPPSFPQAEEKAIYGTGAQTIGKTIIGEGPIPFPLLQEQEKPMADESPQKTIVEGEFFEMPPIPESGEALGRAPAEAALSEDRAGRTMIGEAVLPMPELQMEKEEVKEAVTQARPARAIFLLEIKPPGKEPKTLQLKNGENVVGRLPVCDICIDDDSISRRHAVLIVQAGKVMVRDLGSKNRTFVGNKAIESEVEIKLDTQLKFGAVEAELVYKTGPDA
jgi:pSer/pThr/pTyr-binding forkhead associated (FHA) protein